MLIPLKQKYRVPQPKGHASKTNNSTPKATTIWAKLEASARKVKGRKK